MAKAKATVIKSKAASKAAKAPRSKKPQRSSPEPIILHENETPSKAARRISDEAKENKLHEKEWWKTNVEKVSLLVKLCMRVYEWDDATAKQVLKSYIQFLMVKKEHEDWDAKKFVPCWPVEQMWKQHSSMEDYDFDMTNLCGHVLYRPYGSFAGANQDDKFRLYQSTLKAMESRFGTSFDSDLWSNVIVRFEDQFGEELLYDINGMEPLADYFDQFSYSKEEMRDGDGEDMFTFTFSGNEIKSSDTPNSLCMKSHPDEIVVKGIHKEKMAVCFRHPNGTDGTVILVKKIDALSLYFKMVAEELEVPVRSLVFTFSGHRLFGFCSAKTSNLVESATIQVIPKGEYVDGRCICCQKKSGT